MPARRCGRSRLLTGSGEAFLDVLGDGAGGGEEVGEGLGGVGFVAELGDADGGDDFAVVAGDGCGEGADAFFVFAVDQGPALVADQVEFAAQGGVVDDGVGGHGLDVAGVQERGEPGAGPGGEQDPAGCGGQGGQPDADVEGDGPQAPHGDAGDADGDVVFEDGQVGGFLDGLGQGPQVRHGQFGQGQAGEVGVAEVEDLGGQDEPVALAAQVAEFGEGEGEPAGGGAV